MKSKQDQDMSFELINDENEFIPDMPVNREKYARRQLARKKLEKMLEEKRLRDEVFDDIYSL